jgi:hypothetical protein
MVELQRAYELQPSFKILHSLGQVAEQSHDYAAALRYYKRYLRDGGDEVPAERRREVQQDLSRLEQRVGRLDVQTVESGLDVLVDDAGVGQTPLREPVTVNVGRRKVEISSRAGERQTRVVDVVGGEVVQVRFARLSPPLTLDPDPPPAPVLAASAPRPPPPPAHTRGGTPWGAWIVTALLAGGAATTGALAWAGQRNLDRELDSFPAKADDINATRQRTRTLALATDGLIGATVIMTAISLYLSGHRHEEN